jgi:cell division protease FtsH
VETAYGRAKAILMAKKANLLLVAQTLLEKEVLDRQEFLKLIEGPTAA